MIGRSNGTGRIVAAVAHVSSVMFDKEACASKACRMIAEAAAQGARLLVFPESFIPGFPLWCALQRPIDGQTFFRRFAENSPNLKDPTIRAIAAAAARHRVAVSLGLSEASRQSQGCLWNSNILISEHGELLNHHRKLVPTFYEKLVWASGDGAGLRVVETSVGRIGSLICGENNNPLSRYTLMAQGEEIHTASFPAVWPFRNPINAKPYDLLDAIRVRASAHSFEAKAFTLVSAGNLDEETISALKGAGPDAEDILRACPRSGSMILGPNGDLRSEIRSEGDGLVLAEIDPAEAVELKQHHDMAGYYNRLDIFNVSVDRTRHSAASFKDPAQFETLDLLAPRDRAEAIDVGGRSADTSMKRDSN